MWMEDVMRKWRTELGRRQGQVLAHTLAVLVTHGCQKSKGHPEAGIRTRVGTGGPLQKLAAECQNVLSVTMKLPFFTSQQGPKLPEEGLGHPKTRPLIPAPSTILDAAYPV